MRPDEDFETVLGGGHHNSLGRTLELVDFVLADPSSMPALLDCYHSTDAVVRMRTSNALKRIARQQPKWLLPYLESLLGEVAAIDQPSTRWTLATLYGLLAEWMTPAQKNRATGIMQHNLCRQTDWIVLNTTMQTLADWAQTDESLRSWLLPQLARLEGDKRGSVSKKAAKMAILLSR